jgi:hypothetical protein
MAASSWLWDALDRWADRIHGYLFAALPPGSLAVTGRPRRRYSQLVAVRV